jgi:hypothetical protein
MISESIGIATHLSLSPFDCLTLNLSHSNDHNLVSMRKDETMKAQKIEGAVALVTGANRGIGRALTEALLTRGVRKVYAAARNPETLRALHDERFVPLRLDVTDLDQVLAARACRVPAAASLKRQAALVAPLLPPIYPR